MKTCPECYSEYEDSFDTCPADSSPLKTIEKDPLVGSTLANRYLIESVIGRGGMGVVYKARHQTMDKPMAIKMLHSHLVSEAEAVKRFHREAKTVSQVKHHHIITLYDFGMSAQRQPFLVMDFLEGTSLKSVMKEQVQVPFERAEHIYSQVIDALATAHAQDLVHRDLKPENIMLSHYNNEADWVTLVDFGLSKLKDVKKDDDSSYQITKIGDVCGSPPYMSPEQCMSSQVVDPRSDIYALGICVYETLTGKLPFSAKSAIEMLDCHLYATPTPFNQAVPEFKVCTELTHVLNKALQKDPEHRHQSVEEFGQEFKEAIRRDAVKMRAMKHRIETSAYSDLASEAQALAKQLEGVVGEGLSPSNGDQLDSILVVKEHQKKQSESAPQKIVKTRTDRRTLETGGPLHFLVRLLGGADASNGKSGSSPYTWKKCPFCDAPVEQGVRVCLKCQHPLVSPQELARMNMGGGGSSRGDAPLSFSSKTRNTSNNAQALANMQRLLALLFIAVLCWGAYVGFTNQSVRESVLHLVGGNGASSSSGSSGHSSDSGKNE